MPGPEDFDRVDGKGWRSVLCFRDPDGIQLEMFYRKGHP